MNLLRAILLIVIILINYGKAFSSIGDTYNIITHNKTKVVTDPSKGFNAYKSWSLFPSDDIKFRRAILYVTYQCPDSQKCGEWDYIDNIFLRKKGSVNDSSQDIELARMISPYGSRFTPDWKFTWKTDITDFSFLLHDSVEIEFNHTGYESNTDRGWLVTLDFELTEGTPVMEVLGFEKLWTGKFPYGDPADDIENYLKPFSFENNYGADIARLRILQTGHGMDDYENCAEFCMKYRELYFDHKLIDRRAVWRECSDNPLYPQAGTWIFDRANWCPGSIVRPDIYDLNLNGSSQHVLNIDMEPYINPNKPSANYVFSSYLIYYKNPSAENDVSIEEIVAPDDEDIYSRKNPVCMDPEISIKNNGKNNLNSVKVSYGTNADLPQTFIWKGNLPPDEKINFSLPGLINVKEGKQEYFVKLLQPNDKEDEYEYDNGLKTKIVMPPVFDPKFILLFKTNKESSANFYELRNSDSRIMKKRLLGTLMPDKVYRDTFDLRSGCYSFVFSDTANDGLDFWFNPEGGYGYVRITDINGKLIKSFDSDFGSGIRQQFIVNGEPSEKVNLTPILNIFPVRNQGKFFCDIFLNDKQKITLQITAEDKKKIVFEKKLKNFKEGIVNADISRQKDGLYFVNVITKNGTVSKKMKVKRDN